MEVQRSGPACRVSADIGGTFTDLVVYDERTGTYRAGKVPTTPADLSEGVLAGLAQVAPDLGEIGFAVHGTTVGLNTFLQRNGERVLLLATEGLGHIYHIARGDRSSMYDVRYRKAAPLVPLRDIAEIGGRLAWDGSEVRPLSEADVERVIERARAEDVKAIAVTLLFSYVNPAHELRVEELIQAALPDVTVSLSHRVAREWREYERTSSSVLEAYIAPAVRRYLTGLEREVVRRGLKPPLHVMQSSGGILTAKGARERPLQTLFSGPIGGAVGGRALAELLDRPNLICVDMGGTSFDVSLIEDGKEDIAPELRLDGLPVLMPAVNVHAVGAGGGSIAFVEAGGLRVGPESAGSSPGPACYGRGGTRPTVTDANVLLGRVDPHAFLGGGMTLDVDAARTAIDTVADELTLEPLALAEGILDVINATMSQAIRKVTVERGVEARDFSLVAFGGAGPMHAVFLARELGIKEVIVPPFPGTFSAWGMLQTKIRHDLVRSHYQPLAGLDLAALEARYAMLEEEGRELLAAEGLAAGAMELQRFADVRYQGQEHTITIEHGQASVTGDGFVDALAASFHAAHHAQHGHANPGAPLEIVAARLVALGDLGRAEPAARAAAQPGGAAPTQREVVFEGVAHQTAIVARETLAPSAVLDGPAIIEEHTTTTIVPPSHVVRVDRYGSLLIHAKES